VGVGEGERELMQPFRVTIKTERLSFIQSWFKFLKSKGIPCCIIKTDNRYSVWRYSEESFSDDLSNKNKVDEVMPTEKDYIMVHNTKEWEWV
jgi:hypothetical protein